MIHEETQDDHMSASHLHIWMQYVHLYDHYVVSKAQKKMSLVTLKMLR